MAKRGPQKFVHFKCCHCGELYRIGNNHKCSEVKKMAIDLTGLNTDKKVEVLASNGFITGADRSPESDRKSTHLYKGTFDEPGLPMCHKGWNRNEGYSIWRGNISKKGICKTCLARANKGLDGVIRVDSVK